LRERGLVPTGETGPGDRVAIMVGNRLPFVEALYGALRAGLVPVPLNVGLTRGEIAGIVRAAGARALVVADTRLPAVDGLAEDVPALEHVLVTGAGSPPAGASAWDGLLEGAAPAATVPVEDDAPAVLLYGAAPTGVPQGATLTHGNLRANHAQIAATRLRLEEQDCVLGVLPLFHIFALNVVLAYGLARGASVLLLERFGPLEALRAVARRRATVLAGAPLMYRAWADLPEQETFDLACVRYAVSGAAALPPEVQMRFTERFGVPLWQGYGLTETAPVLTTTAMGGGPKPGSVGRPVPDVQLRLVADGGGPVRRGDPGEILVRGPNVFAGYWDDPAATRAVVDAEGWFATGDIAYADADGDLHLVDRKRDLVIVSGFNVYPREVEAVLLRHPDVVEAAVVGAPDPRTGETVQAFVVLAPGAEPDPDALRAFARGHLARFKVPTAVDVVAELPQLPSGRLRRHRLRAPDDG
jgi:long-chain acyl-CoA synthetase